MAKSPDKILLWTIPSLNKKGQQTLVNRRQLPRH